MKLQLLLVLIISIFGSCDCVQIAEGIIVDNETGKPLSNIIVYQKDDTENHIATDTGGRFQLSSISGCTCPPMTVIINDNHYKTVEISVRGEGEKIKLERIKPVERDSISPVNAIQKLRDIFEDYTRNNDGVDNADNKNAVTLSLQSLDIVKDPKDLELLINIWNYYDPTDFNCRDLVVKVLLRNKEESIKAVKKRIRNKPHWETGETEFKYLLKALKTK